MDEYETWRRSSPSDMDRRRVVVIAVMLAGVLIVSVGTVLTAAMEPIAPDHLVLRAPADGSTRPVSPDHLVQSDRSDRSARSIWPDHLVHRNCAGGSTRSIWPDHLVQRDRGDRSTRSIWPDHLVARECRGADGQAGTVGSRRSAADTFSCGYA